MAKPLVIGDARPFVILVVGVNGSGKTTTIGKLAAKLAAEGRKVVLAAGDTFRAAAIDQLKIWGGRTGAKVVAREQGADSAGLAFDALSAAKSENADVLIVDTAGRLQNRAELMNELEKMVRVMKKLDPAAPHAVLLVLDATVGQNALSQVEVFGKIAGVTGLVMTKLDGTARGGILVSIAEKFKLPIHFIGVGEGVDDLAPFQAEDFGRALAGTRVDRSVDPRTKVLLEAPIAPTLLRLAIPNVVTTLVQASTGLIETYFIGKLGTDALAGVALVFPGVMLMQMMSAGAMGGGVSSAIARALGSGRRDDADATILHALIIAAGFAAFFSVAMLAVRSAALCRARRPRRLARRGADLFQHRVRGRHPDLAVQHARQCHPRHRQHLRARGGDDGRRGASGAAVGGADFRLRAAAGARRGRRRASRC